MPQFKKIFSIVRRGLFFILPFILLYLIFQRVDFGQLSMNLQQTDPVFVLLGIGLRPLQIVLGAVRWRVLTNHYCRVSLSSVYMVRHYWTGLGLGYFTPGSLGWDAYRVVVIGNRLKAYTGPIISIIAEKFMGLFSVSSLLIIIFPLVVTEMEGDTYLFRRGYYLLWCVLLIGAMFIGGIVWLKLFRFTRVVKAVVNRMALKVARSTGTEPLYRSVQDDYLKSNTLISLLRHPIRFSQVYLLSLGILVVAAVCSQFIFQGLHYDLNVFINLFAAPVFFILFLIPISFGSIGVREGAFILVYGLFGVPLEIALLVSFFNLFGLFLNAAIGAVFIWLHK